MRIVPTYLWNLGRGEEGGKGGVRRRGRVGIVKRFMKIF